MSYANPQAAGLASNTQTTGLNPGAPISQTPSAGFMAGGGGAGPTTPLYDFKIIRAHGSGMAF